jgi:hypothetical protein
MAEEVRGSAGYGGTQTAERRFFSEGLSSTREPVSIMQLHSPLYQQMGLSGACGSSLAGVPTCAGQCRFVRVIPLCVGRSSPGQPSRQRPGPSVPGRSPKTGRRRPPTWSATYPATLRPGPGMTHRDERNVRR